MGEAPTVEESGICGIGEATMTENAVDGGGVKVSEMIGELFGCHDFRGL